MDKAYFTFFASTSSALQVSEKDQIEATARSTYVAGRGAVPHDLLASGSITFDDPDAVVAIELVGDVSVCRYGHAKICAAIHS